MNSSTNIQGEIKPMTVFPTVNSLNELMNQAESQLPITTKNEVYSLLATYHNTLLRNLNNGN